MIRDPGATARKPAVPRLSMPTVAAGKKKKPAFDPNRTASNTNIENELTPTAHTKPTKLAKNSKKGNLKLANEGGAESVVEYMERVRKTY
jgi:hypothetical protein